MPSDAATEASCRKGIFKGEPGVSFNGLKEQHGRSRASQDGVQE